MQFKTVSIIIPVYNEENTLETLIRSVEEASAFNLTKEIILIDDGSTDNCRKILQKFEKKHRVFYHQNNKGKGAALYTGFNNITGDIVIIQDADLEYNPNEYEKLLQPIINNEADVVYGSRFLGGNPHRVLYYWHYLGNKFLTTFSNICTNLNLTDMETCYKVFRKEILFKVKEQISSNRFGFEPEITAKISKLAKKNQCRIFEVGISYYGRTYASGKKITWKDGVAAFWIIIKSNFLN